MKDDQPNLVAPLVSIHQQREDSTFRCFHALGSSHRPGSIDHEEDQVGSTADAHFALQIGFGNGESNIGRAGCRALLLIDGSLAQRGIKRDVVHLAIGRPGFDIMAAFSFGMGNAAFACALPRQAIQRSIEPFGLEALADYSPVYRRCALYLPGAAANGKYPGAYRPASGQIGRFHPLGLFFYRRERIAVLCLGSLLCFLQ